MNVLVKYKVSDGVVKQHFVKTGEILPVEHQFQIDAALPELQPLREEMELYHALGRDASPRPYLAGSYRQEGLGAPSAFAPVDVHPDQLQTQQQKIDFLLADLAERPRRHQQHQAYLEKEAAYRRKATEDVWRPIYRAAITALNNDDLPYSMSEQPKWTPGSELAQLRDEYEAAKAAYDARQAQAKAQYEADMKVWIDAHGSERLRMAYRQGYSVTRLYAEERSATEYPEYYLDYDDTAEWTNRASPSQAAMEEAVRVGGRVVWVKNSDEENGEAVVVRGFLRKYNLFKFYAE
jgi:hypothetical protein